jgi:hypothetical protein
MAPPAQYTEQFLVCREYGERAIEKPLAVRVALAIHDDVLEVLLRDAVCLDGDEYVGEAVAGERVGAASPRARGRPGESAPSRTSLASRAIAVVRSAGASVGWRR